MKTIIYLCVAFFTLQEISAQDQKEKAINIANEAIRIMDNGQVEESIALLEQARELDPTNINIPYEIAYANYLLKDYKKSIEILELLVDNKAATDLFYQLLGNSYDYSGNREQAIITYNKGLSKMPKSGRLHMELGIMYLNVKDYDKAIDYYEKGMIAEPNYSSNYYHAAKIYLNSDLEVWGMIYGEIFMNLERNSARTAEMSKLLYDTYENEIQFSSDTEFTVSFCNEVIDATGKKVKLPFGLAVYEPVLIFSIIGEKEIDINSLSRIRTRFIEFYFSNHHDRKYPNVLFDFQKDILISGNIDAYNHWILMKGDENMFEEWHIQHETEWQKFVEWFNPNNLRIADNQVFVRNKESKK